MLGRQLSQHNKFKFCFLEISGFLKNIFDTQLGESLDSEPEDTQDQLYSQDPPPKKNDDDNDVENKENRKY